MCAFRLVRVISAAYHPVVPHAPAVAPVSPESPADSVVPKRSSLGRADAAVVLEQKGKESDAELPDDAPGEDPDRPLCFPAAAVALMFQMICADAAGADITDADMFESMQLQAEEEGLIALHDEAMDDFVPVTIVEACIHRVVAAYKSELQAFGVIRSTG